VEVPVSLPRGYAKSLQAVHGDAAVPSAVLSADLYSDGSLREVKLAVLANLRGLGVASYELRPAQADAKIANEPSDMLIDNEKLTLGTPFWDVHFCREGGVSSIKDKHSGREFLRAQSPGCLFAGKIDGQDMTSKG
jgi:hypothetical protein